MTLRCWKVAVLIGGLVVATGAYAAEEYKAAKVIPPGKSFYRNFLAPQMAKKLNGDIDAAVEFANPAANPWMKDDETVRRVQRNAVSATKKALKRYALESMHLDTWSLPLFKNAAKNSDPTSEGLGNQIQRARVRFGISHMRPRAEVLIPATHGRISVGADARGVFGASFETPSSNFRLGVNYDHRTRAAGFSLNRSF